MSQNQNSRTKQIYIGILLVLIALFFLLASSVFYFYSNNQSVWILIIIISVSSVFLFLLLLYKMYEKFTEKINPFIVVCFVYILLTLNMFFSPNLYSIEYSFLAFIFAAVIFYDSGIDSKFLTFPALLLICYLPFILLAKENSLAVTISVYAFYFLISAVTLEIIQNLKKTPNSISFSYFLDKLIKNKNIGEYLIVTGIISIFLIIINRFNEIELWKYTFVYVFSVFLVVYLLSMIKKDD